MACPCSHQLTSIHTLQTLQTLPATLHLGDPIALSLPAWPVQCTRPVAPVAWILCPLMKLSLIDIVIWYVIYTNTCWKGYVISVPSVLLPLSSSARPRHLLQGLEVAVAKGPPHGRADGHVVIILIVGHHLVTMAWCIPTHDKLITQRTTVPPGWLPWRFGVLARLPCSPALAAHLDKAQVEWRSTRNKQNNLFVFHQTIQSQLYGTNLKHFVFKCRDLFSMFIHWFVLRAFIFPGQSFKKDGVTCCSEPGDTWDSDLGSLYTRNALTSSWIKGVPAAVGSILHFPNFCIHSKRNMQCTCVTYVGWQICQTIPHFFRQIWLLCPSISRYHPHTFVSFILSGRTVCTEGFTLRFLGPKSPTSWHLCNSPRSGLCHLYSNPPFPSNQRCPVNSTCRQGRPLSSWKKQNALGQLGMMLEAKVESLWQKDAKGVSFQVNLGMKKDAKLLNKGFSTWAKGWEVQSDLDPELMKTCLQFSWSVHPMITESGASSSLCYPNIKDGFGQTASTIHCKKKSATPACIWLKSNPCMTCSKSCRNERSDSEINTN